MQGSIFVQKHKAFSVMFVLLALGIALTTVITFRVNQPARAAGSLEGAFSQAAQEFSVPEDLLKAICQESSHISVRDGQSSIDGSYGCGLVKRPVMNAETMYGGPLSQDIKKHAGVSSAAPAYAPVDTLDQAAGKLGVAPEMLQRDLVANIRGVAFILRNDAEQIAPTHQLPTTVAEWRPVVEVFSHATTRFAAHLYASQVYGLLQSGFSTTDDSGEVISVNAQRLSASVAAIALSASTNDPASVASLPVGCSNDGKTDYAGAVDCILDPTLHDCDIVPGATAPCNYFSSDHYSPTYRQNDGTITHIVIHDSEANNAAAVINTFEDPLSSVSAHYIVDTDGTVYQIVHEKDVAFHAGNLWYNQHAIGIEHVGFDATGFQYYNSAQYLASAKLTAFLAQKYQIPLDHNHVVSHGTIPGPNLANTPNNVDPGPYWLWDYYLQLAQEQSKQVVQSADAAVKKSHIITLRPKTDVKPALPNGTETAANFNFFYLYNGPSTKSGLIPQEGNGTDITDETNNVEPAISYYYIKKVVDPAGTGDTLYEIWYGESDQAHSSTPTFFTHAKRAWLAVPPATAIQGAGTAVTLKSSDGTPIQVSGSPKTNTAYYIGDAPNGAVFVSGYKVTEDGTNNVWYSINYNHRQAWVPASAVVVTA